jgi:hypothetical protein
LGKTQDEQIEETKLCQNSLPTHPSIYPSIHPPIIIIIIIISPSHPTHYWSHPIGALIGRYDKTLPKYLTCCHTYLLWYTNYLRQH